MRAHPRRRLGLAIAAMGIAASLHAVELDERCTVSVLNRSAQVDSDGRWIVRNVPTNMGLVRARATCVQDGVTITGQSDSFVVPPSGVIAVREIHIRHGANRL